MKCAAKLISAAFFFGAFSVANAGDLALSIKKSDVLIVQAGSKSKNIKLNHNIIGYEINCSKEYLLVWGKPRDFNVNNPQDSTLTIIDLRSLGNVKLVGFDKNIFDVEFEKSGQSALIQGAAESKIDLMAGKSILTNDAGASFESENCGEFKFKSYRKFKN